VCVCVCVCVDVCVCVCVCACVCMCVCVRAHTHTQTNTQRHTQRETTHMQEGAIACLHACAYVPGNSNECHILTCACARVLMCTCVCAQICMHLISHTLLLLQRRAKAAHNFARLDVRRVRMCMRVCTRARLFACACAAVCQSSFSGCCLRRSRRPRRMRVLGCTVCVWMRKGVARCVCTSETIHGAAAAGKLKGLV